MLTTRQRQIAKMVAQGQRPKQIARSLGISINTVESHIKEAAHRLPGHARPHQKLTIWFLSLNSEQYHT